MPNEIAFGNYVFPSQQAARRECERRLKPYGHMDYLRRDDREFFLELFACRLPNFAEVFFGDEDPDLAEKPSLQRINWKQFSVNTPFNHLGMRAIREDGSWSPVSFRQATDQATHRGWVFAAAKREVQSQLGACLRDWKIKNGNVSCLSGPTDEPLIVGHHISTSMSSLLDRWMRESMIDFDDINTKVEKGNAVNFRNVAFAESWRKFHRKHARLEVIANSEYFRPDGHREH